MRSTPVIVILLGIIVVLSGLTFALQGLGIVGPQSSFMFNSQSWIIQGGGVMVLGLVMILIGVWLWRRRGPAPA
jgi:hypothetical protein